MEQRIPESRIEKLEKNHDKVKEYKAMAVEDASSNFEQNNQHDK